jgi:hypothetical protein
MGIVENRPRRAAARAASAVEVEILTPTEFLDQIAGSPRTARELIQRLSQRLREADDRIVNDERRSGRAEGNATDADSRTAVALVNNAYLAAKNPWLQGQFDTPVGLGDQKRLEQQHETEPHGMVRQLARIVGVGVETADMLVHELLSRPMRDRRAVARYAGLTGSPDESGARRREQGLARAGNARVRRGMIQLAWRFLMFQKDSALALWHLARTTDSRSGTRKAMIAVPRTGRELAIGASRARR